METNLGCLNKNQKILAVIVNSFSFLTALCLLHARGIQKVLSPTNVGLMISAETYIQVL